MPGAITTVHQHLDRRAVEAPDDEFVFSIGQGRGITFGAFDRASRQLAGFLAEEGVTPADRVSLFAANTVESTIAYLGVQRHGAAVNPINVRQDPMQVAAILGDVGPRVVIFAEADRELAERSTAAAPDALWVGYTDLDDPSAAPGSLFDRTSTVAPDAWAGPPDHDGPAIIAHTSGSTGVPKGVVHSRSSLHHSTEASVELVAMTADDRLLEFRDLSWLSPQVLTIAATVATGATAVLAPTFSRGQFFDWLEGHEITVAVGVPSVINMLLEEADGAPVPPGRFPHLRFMTSSTAPLTVERHERFEAHYGIEILQLMGMSEAGWIAGNRPGRRKVGTVGPAAPHQRVRVVDEQGEPVPAGVEGEIVVGGAQVAMGYLREGEIVPIDDRDVLPTGDLGRLDDDGYLTVTGRKKDLINRGGVNISPKEVADALLTHPAVVEAAVVGVPDPIYGEEVAAFVVLAGAAEADELVEHCRARVSPYKLPRTVDELDRLPTTDRGKLDHGALVDSWQAAHAQG